MYGFSVISSVPPSTTSKTVNKIKKFTQKVEKRAFLNLMLMFELSTT